MPLLPQLQDDHVGKGGEGEGEGEAERETGREGQSEGEGAAKGPEPPEGHLPVLQQLRGLQPRELLRVPA